MSEQREHHEGIKVLQQPGGTSQFTLKWHSPEPKRDHIMQV